MLTIAIGSWHPASVPLAHGAVPLTWRRGTTAAKPQRRPRHIACSAATEQGRQAAGAGANSRSSSTGWSRSSDNKRDANPGLLLGRITACTTASQLHQLLLCHSGELTGVEVAAALEVSAKRSLLSHAENAADAASSDSGTAGSSERSGSASNAALASLLVQLAAAHVPRMEPAALSLAAWALGVLQLDASRPVMRTMHALAKARITQHSPSQLCDLLWAGNSLDPSFRSPLLSDLAGLLDCGMNLSFFASQDLAMLAWLCGRERIGVAKDVLVRVAEECRCRLEAHREQLERLQQRQARRTAASTNSQSPGILWKRETRVGKVVPALGTRMRSKAWMHMISTIKDALREVTEGEVFVELELCMSSRSELNPVLVATYQGEPASQPIKAYGDFKYGKHLKFWLHPFMDGLQQAAAGEAFTGAYSSRAGDVQTKGSHDWPAAALSQAEAVAVQQECGAAGLFWAAVTAAGMGKVMDAASSFSAVATLASGSRLQLTWRRLDNELLPMEVAELSPVAGPPRSWQWGHKLQQEREQREGQRPPPLPRPPPPPPPPFNPTQAAMLLAGLAAAQLRVGGIVDPLLQQCQPALERDAHVDDVVGIVVALGELQMEPACELMRLLVERVAACRDSLSPQQMVAVAWAVVKAGSYGNLNVAAIGARHLATNLEAYQAVDLVGLLWACARLSSVLPDDTLELALHRLTPLALQWCSNTALCNLVWALGKLVAMRTGAERCRNASVNSDSAPLIEAWVAVGAGAATQAVGAAAASELARRAKQLKPHELSAAAVALAAHSTHPTLLPAQTVTAIQGACATAAASNAFNILDLHNLTLAAARLHWNDSLFLDSLTACLAPRVTMLVQPGEVARALACLAPARYGPLFASLLRTYIITLKQPGIPRIEEEVEERANVLASLAVVARAQGLPTDLLKDLCVTMTSGLLGDLKRMPLPAMAALLELAACAGLKRTVPRLAICRQLLLAKLEDSSPEMLRQAWPALERLGCEDPAVEAARKAQLSRLT